MASEQRIFWKRTAIEASAIVASILLAFSIDAWWDGVQQGKQTQALLSYMEAAFTENVNLLDQNISYIEVHQSLLKRFLETDPDDVNSIPPERRFETLHSIWRPATMPNNNILLAERLDTENVSFSEYPALQDAITQWRADATELEERQGLKLANESDALLALGRHNDVGIIWANYVEGPVPRIDEELIKSVREDERIMAIVARKIWLNRVHVLTLQRNRDGSVAVLAHIQSALDERIQ